jgi:hypothetical protein
MDRGCKNPVNLSIQDIFELSILELRHVKNPRVSIKPLKPMIFHPRTMDKVELSAYPNNSVLVYSNLKHRPQQRNGDGPGQR